ncbi:TPA: hypothetical protein HA235_00985 [Candidatus Woesearchaeota archaeon]|nr:hypothetical protein [Candidatus Woesearchaeota archaeon]HIH31260.1 hypothetical protein [Candidatus Woesearchaeota archaeon]HIH54857.1 hypothetical protein [Candidatus Woesearchaeota archaeon]HIJ01762.1 hypothetical protein [Candidatus Woesearchaeota archaeon]HIJ13525.1 hypothetical protein [Candidatus Woesearchaeota archaeon]
MSLSNHKKAALELSANAIVIIIISIVILGSGIAIFYNIKNNAEDKIRDMDQRTQDQIKALMLSNNYKVSVYPNTLKLNNGDAESVGLGIQNNEQETLDFKLEEDIENLMIKYYAKPESPVEEYPNTGMKYLYMETLGGLMIADNLKAKGVYIRTLLVKMPKDAKKGEYVITLSIQSRKTVGGGYITNDYDTVQIFVIND